MSSFDDNFKWQEQFIPQVVRLIAPHLITVGSAELDKNQVGDLVLALPRNGTVSVRLRRPETSARFRDDVTFRTVGRNGQLAELNKVAKGFGDYFFYGHVNKENQVWYWRFMDLSLIRYAFMRNYTLLPPFNAPLNAPDGSKFIACQPELDFPDAIIAKCDSITKEPLVC